MAKKRKKEKTPLAELRTAAMERLMVYRWISALFARERDDDPVVLVAPSDHLTPDLDAFGDRARRRGVRQYGREVTVWVK